MGNNRSGRFAPNVSHISISQCQEEAVKSIVVRQFRVESRSQQMTLLSCNDASI
jgi:hypothetical protein